MTIKSLHTMPREKKSSLKNKNSCNNNCNDVNDNEIMPTKASKKRRTSNAANQSHNQNQNSNNNISNNSGVNSNKSLSAELIPPQPISTFGDTIIASNPFDDTPHTPHTPQPMPMTPTGAPVMPSLQQSGPGGPIMTTRTSTQSPNNSNVSMPSSGGQVPPKPVPLMSGKIYPPEQSMVFNPANPNAPPIYPCGICHKEVHDNDQAILCESGCNFWFHRVCSGLTDRAYFLLTQEVYAEWVCDKCTSNKNIPLVKFKP